MKTLKIHLLFSQKQYFYINISSNKYLVLVLHMFFLFYSGWEFVDTVMSNRETFRGFRECYAKKHMKYNPSGANFMSVQTLIQWFLPGHLG